MTEINARAFQKLDGSRQMLLKRLDRPALRLPLYGFMVDSSFHFVGYA